MNSPSQPTKKEIVTEFRTRGILDAARRLLQSRGVESVTMEEIAAAAGVAKGTVYLYFQGKEDLVYALLSQSGEKLIQGLKALLETPGSVPEKLNRVVAFLLNFLEQERVLFPVYARESSPGPTHEHPGRGSRIRELEEEFVALLSRYFAEGIEASQFIPADPRLLTLMVRELVRAVGYFQMLANREDAITEALPVMQALLAGGLLARPRDEVEAI
jgi:AcrR family transcriptional regulator